jgi:hypothetical protein
LQARRRGPSGQRMMMRYLTQAFLIRKPSISKKSKSSK